MKIIPCRGLNPDLNETNGIFKFPRHLQTLVQNNNWFRMVIVTGWRIDKKWVS